MAKKKKSKIQKMYIAYGENFGSICRNCCNLIAVKNIDGKCTCKYKAYGVSKNDDTNWHGKHMGCGLYNMPFNDTKYSPIFKKKVSDRNDKNG